MSTGGEGLRLWDEAATPLEIIRAMEVRLADRQRNADKGPLALQDKDVLRVVKAALSLAGAADV